MNGLSIPQKSFPIHQIWGACSTARHFDSVLFNKTTNTFSPRKKSITIFIHNILVERNSAIIDTIVVDNNIIVVCGIICVSLCISEVFLVTEVLFGSKIAKNAAKIKIGKSDDDTFSNMARNTVKDVDLTWLSLFHCMLLSIPPVRM